MADARLGDEKGRPVITIHTQPCLLRAVPDALLKVVIIVFYTEYNIIIPGLCTCVCLSLGFFTTPVIRSTEHFAGALPRTRRIVESTEPAAQTASGSSTIGHAVGRLRTGPVQNGALRPVIIYVVQLGTAMDESLNVPFGRRV